MRRSGLNRLWHLVVVAVGSVLLLSMGGAIVAAPVTLPLLYLVLRADRAGAGVRAAAAVIAAVTVAEIAWAATYLAMAEAQPWIWLLPLAAGSAVAGLLAQRPVAPAAT
jgi:hypothetical protein